MKKSLLLLAVLAALSGCASWWNRVPSATATLAPTSGSSTSGIVKFSLRDGVVQVTGEVRGLRASEEHGFHIHERGDCSSPDGSSAGGHWNPTGQPHGQLGPGPHHAGDLASLRADGNGVAQFSFLLPGVDLASLTGKGVIVHRDRDDFSTQPAGNSGPRLACGVIVSS